MGAYVKTGPFVNGSSPGISANFLNNLEQVLSQNSGNTEVGHYFLTFNASANAYYGSCYIPTLSRGVAPVSVSIDTADGAATNCAAPTTADLTSGGFHVIAQSTGNFGNIHVGGNFTVTF